MDDTNTNTNTDSTSTVGIGSVFSGSRESFRCTDTKGQLIVVIHVDGQVELGPNYTPSEAAKEFWRAVSDVWESFYA